MMFSYFFGASLLKVVIYIFDISSNIYVNIKLYTHMFKKFCILLVNFSSTT